MYCRGAVRAALLSALLIGVSCSRRPASPGLERLAILRFENLSSDPSIDWMGRAFSEIITRELAPAPGIYSIPFERLHAGDAGRGIRPWSAPGISAEQGLAVATGATRIGYGEYWRQGNRLMVRLTLEDPQAPAQTQVLSTSNSGGSAPEAANALARQISSGTLAPVSLQPAAWEPYVTALESRDPARKTQALEQAIAADPNFGPAYVLLAQVHLQSQDRSGAEAVLNRGLARGGALPPIERARLSFEAANLRGDGPWAERSLADWARLTPNDPAVWNASAETAMNHHQYAAAAQAYQKAVELEPGDVALLNQFGYAAAYAGDLKTAMQALQRYSALRPADVNPLDSEGDINLLLGRLKEAASFYQQAAKKDPAFLNGGDYFKGAMALLMSGDTGGADALDKQFVEGRAAAKDPLTDFHRAEWAWLSGRRKDALSVMNEFARRSESGPLRELASQAYGQLAVWNVALGNRSQAVQMGERAGALAGSGSAALAVVARFLSMPSASAAEWTSRAERLFPLPAQKPLKDVSLVYALLADQHYQAAAAVLEPLYNTTSPTADDTMPLLLAWTYLETGKPKEAASLLRFNPLPPNSGVKPFSVFYFPRLFYLRGRVAALAGNADQARAQFQLFRQLSGDTDLMWGEEKRAN